MVLRYNSGNKGGIRLSKLNYSYHRFLNNNRNKGIPNLMLWICIGNALVYFLSQFGTPLSLYSALSFDPQAIAHGQVWRLFSYIFTFAGIGDMSIYSIFSVALALYCSYWPARYLEQLWGSLRVNLYYLIGILAMDVYAMLVYFLFHVSYGVSALYLNLSMFLAFAVLFPDVQVLLFFIIPIKVKYLAYVDAALFVLGIVTTSFPLNLLPVVAVLNYLVYCGDWLFDFFRPSHVRQRQKTVNFKREARRIQREQANKPYHYKCAVCGRTDVDHPELEFRYCSRCVGYHCFCQDHINNHVHFTE